MRKLTYLFFFIASFYLSLALLYGPMDLSVVETPLNTHQTQYYYKYKGAVNVHSNKSSGSGSIDEIGLAAQDAQLDFVVVTDVNDFEVNNQRETYYGNSLVLQDGEYSYLDSRLLNLNFENKNHLLGPGRSQLVISNLLSKDEPDPETGFFVLSHPLKEGYEWTGELPVGLNGIEIYNLRYIWRRAWMEKRNSFIWALLLYPINIQWSFSRLFASYTHPEIEYWDRNNKGHKLFAYAGADAESRARMPGGDYWRIPSYKSLFSVLKNHVSVSSELTGDPKADRQKLMSGLKAGNFHIGLDLIGDSSGFDMFLISKDGKSLPMGSELKLKNASQIKVSLDAVPRVPFEITIFKNGESIFSSNSADVTLDIQSSGVYRCVVTVKLDFPFPDKDRWIPWVTSNPVYIR